MKAVRGGAADVDEDEEEAPANGRTPKKRFIADLFEATPAVDAVILPSTAADDEEEVLCAMVRRTTEMRRKRCLEERAAEEQNRRQNGLRRGEFRWKGRRSPLPSVFPFWHSAKHPSPFSLHRRYFFLPRAGSALGKVFAECP